MKPIFNNKTRFWNLCQESIQMYFVLYGEVTGEIHVKVESVYSSAKIVLECVCMSFILH